jgi:hypothetical protein
MTDFPAMTLETPAEHPFAQFVRILGKGKRGARDLTREEAREAMGMVLDDKVEDTQLGAFLMLLRHKEESAEEMAGFTEALRARLQAPELNVDLDWPTYAGKKRHLPWYLLAAKCLAQNGVRIFMHGGGAHTAGRLYSEQLLDELNIPLCRTWQQAGTALDNGGLAFMPLVDWAAATAKDDRSTQQLGPTLTDSLPGTDSQSAGRTLRAAKHFPSWLSGRASRCQWFAWRHGDCGQGRWRRNRDQPGCRQPPLRHHRRARAGTRSGRRCRRNVTSNRQLWTLNI